MKTKAAAIAGLLLTTMIWGFAFVVVKNTLDSLSPLWMMAVRFTLAAVGLCLFCLKRLKNSTKGTLRAGLILGLLLFTAYVLQTYGCLYTTAGKNAFLTALYVVLVPFCCWLLFRQTPNGLQLLAAFIGIVGIGLICLTNDLSIGLGDFLTLLCGLAFAVHIAFLSRYTAKYDPVLLTLFQFAVCAVLSLIAAPLFEGRPSAAAFSLGNLGSLAYLGFLSTLLCFLLQSVCQKILPPAPAALLLSLESVFGVVAGCLFLGEPASLRMLAGCAILFFAVILSQWPRKETPGKLPA